jgi:putative ABC transport system ATP-binding protein
MSEEHYTAVCREITKKFTSGGTTTHALRGVSLDLKKRELLMLVGPSGCGKTTLISIIAGILNYDSGSCKVLGKELKALSEKERCAFRGSSIGFIFQSFNLIPTLTACENGAVPLLLQGKERKEALSISKELLSKVGLAEKLNRLPRELSGGEQQRVAIARALVHQPSLIVCDEPTSALDQQSGHKVLELFQSVASNCSILIVTHDSRIFEFAHRIIKMNDGAIDNDH